MKRGLILVEGPTEETFVLTVLNDHLSAFDLHMAPKILTTKRVVDGPDMKGGTASYAKVSGDLRRLLGDTNVAVITTMIDYYALPPDFPGMSTRPGGDQLARVRHVEASWGSSVDESRFLPNLMLHEFEALLFADPPTLRGWLLPSSVTAKMDALLAAVHGNPEVINERRDTSPSHRILNWHADYDKVVDGNRGVQKIGLAAIRSRCPHFSRWVEDLEAVGRGLPPAASP